ncbi:hypothetical protein HGRIS_006203 [Hohenbuehelia grisea]|uniref:Uncharacterized protein n=1 Tax=Hohenbuehelia grisea TaxID=104357 RepID=A0ABR3K1L4_9AGAR
MALGTPLAGQDGVQERDVFEIGKEAVQEFDQDDSVPAPIVEEEPVEEAVHEALPAARSLDVWDLAYDEEIRNAVYSPTIRPYPVDMEPSTSIIEPGVRVRMRNNPSSMSRFLTGGTIPDSDPCIESNLASPAIDDAPHFTSPVPEVPTSPMPEATTSSVSEAPASAPVTEEVRGCPTCESYDSLICLHDVGFQTEITSRPVPHWLEVPQAGTSHMRPEYPSCNSFASLVCLRSRSLDRYRPSMSVDAALDSLDERDASIQGFEWKDEDLYTPMELEHVDRRARFDADMAELLNYSSSMSLDTFTRRANELKARRAAEKAEGPQQRMEAIKLDLLINKEAYMAMLNELREEDERAAQEEADALLTAQFWHAMVPPANHVYSAPPADLLLPGGFPAPDTSLPYRPAEYSDDFEPRVPDDSGLPEHLRKEMVWVNRRLLQLHRRELWDNAKRDEQKRRVYVITNKGELATPMSVMVKDQVAGIKERVRRGYEDAVYDLEWKGRAVKKLLGKKMMKKAKN